MGGCYPKGKVTIIGGGVIGTHAARIALRLGARYHLRYQRQTFSRSEDVFGHQIQTPSPTPLIIEASTVMLMLSSSCLEYLVRKLQISDDMVKQMRPGSVIVDVAVDQGG